MQNKSSKPGASKLCARFHLLLWAVVLEFAINRRSQHADEPARLWLGALGAQVKTDNSAQQHLQHPSLFVDTKFWLRNTELEERANWLDGRKPCSLLERIVIGGQEDEPMVVSLGNAFSRDGALESNLREIVLSQDNGVLLLDEEANEVQSAEITKDKLYAQSLTDSECVEKLDDEQYQSFYYQFQPHPDDLSWFNRANWRSLLIDSDEIYDWAPQSHQIPCTEDVVIFASRQELALSAELDHGKNMSANSFKVNFKASHVEPKRVSDTKLKGGKISNLRVSKLIIGQQSYTQKELQQLVTKYGDSLFQFGDNNSLLDNRDYINGDSLQLPLTIDQSSIQDDPTYDLCLEEAGCLCGNERNEVMEAICSFEEPLVYPDDYACKDPIEVTGYCDKICATVLTVQMDPSKFSDRFVSDLLNKMLFGGDSNEVDPSFGEHLFASGRRVDHAKYDVTFRLVSYDKADYEQSLGKDREFAQMMQAKLEIPATKSLYGIKNTRIVSSVRWRTDNRMMAFLMSFCVTAPLLLVIFFREDTIVWFKFTTSTNALVSNVLRHQNKFSWQYRNNDGPSLVENIQLVDAERQINSDDSDDSVVPLVNIENAMRMPQKISEQ